MTELFGTSWSRRELLRRLGRLEQAAGVRLVTLGDGGGRGVRVLEFRTGTGFAFDVLVDRAFDVGRAELRGLPLAWLSGVGVEGPWYAEQEELGFLRGWGGGLLTTCGIEHALFMAQDGAAQYHYPPKQTESFGLHGRVSGRPARLAGYRSFHGPEQGYVEQVFEHELAAEPEGTVPVAIANRRLGLGLYEVFRRDQLPHHFLWRMLGEGTYAVAIEPSTNRVAGRLDARSRGELIELEAGETRAYELELGALDGAAAIDAFAARVDAAMRGSQL